TPKLAGQDGDLNVATRAEQVEEARDKKAAQAAQHPPAPARFALIGRLMEEAPIRVAVLGLGPGHGLWLGCKLGWTNSSHRFDATVFGAGSTDYFYIAGTGIEFKNLSSRNLNLSLEAYHSDAPQLRYYGPGPNSSIQNQTDYRREDTLFNLRASVPA